MVSETDPKFAHSPTHPNPWCALVQVWKNSEFWRDLGRKNNCAQKSEFLFRITSEIRMIELPRCIFCYWQNPAKGFLHLSFDLRYTTLQSTTKDHS